MSDQGFWDWAVAAYAAPGVGEACLHLQDALGNNVPLLLWAAWAARTGRRPDADDVEAACDLARGWSSTTVEPLRAVRRALKIATVDITDDDRLALREQVKAIEMQAERVLMNGLATLAPAPSGSPRPAIDALAEVARGWSGVVPRPALIRLAERLPA